MQKIRESFIEFYNPRTEDEALFLLVKVCT